MIIPNKGGVKYIKLFASIFMIKQANENSFSVFYDTYHCTGELPPRRGLF